MKTVALVLLTALAPAGASAAPPRAFRWIAQAPPKPPEPPDPARPRPPRPPRVIVIKSGPGGHTWTVPTRKRPFLGVQLLELTDELRSHFGVEAGVGIMISKVEKDTPAAKAGVQAGDVLTAIDGTRVGSAREVVRTIRTKKEGDAVKLEVMRNRKKRTLKAELAVRETPQIDLSGLFQFHPGEGELRLEVDGKDIEIPLPPMPQVEELREHFRELQEDEVFKQYKKEKDLEKRLKELEKKLRELEGKMKQGKVKKTPSARDA